MPIDLRQVNEVTDAVIGSAIKVHRALGPGLLESAYLACLVFELHRLGIDIEVEKKLPIRYEDVRLDCGYKLDILAKDLVVVEIKSVRQLAAIHTAQVLTYLKLTGCPVGLLINFNVPLLRHGVRRLLNANPTKGLIESGEPPT